LKTLITAGTTAAAYKLKRLLNKDSMFIFADEEMPAFMPAGSSYVKIPSGDSPSFAHEMLKLSLDLEVERIFPLRRAEILSLSEAAPLFEEYGIKPIVPLRSDIEQYLRKTKKADHILVVENGLVAAAEEDAFSLKSFYSGSGIFCINPQNISDFTIFTVD